MVDINKLAAIILYHTVVKPCKNKFKCGICAILECKGNNPLHYSKAGCPNCSIKLILKCVICNIPITLEDGFDMCLSCIKEGK